MSLSLCCISQRGNDETIDNNTTRCYRLRSGLFPVLPCLLNKHSASPVCCKVLKNLLQVQPTPPPLVNSRSVSRHARPLCHTALLQRFEPNETRSQLRRWFQQSKKNKQHKGLTPRGRQELFVKRRSHRRRTHRERLLPDADCKRRWRKIAGMLFTATAVNLLQTFLRTSLFPKSFITLGLN